MTTEYESGVLRINKQGEWELILFKGSSPIPDMHLKFRAKKMNLDDTLLPDDSAERGSRSD